MESLKGRPTCIVSIFRPPVSKDSEQWFRKRTAVQTMAGQKYKRRRKMPGTPDLPRHGSGLNISSREQSRRIVVQNLPLRRGSNRERVELLNVSLDLRNARPGPVLAPH